MEYTMFDLIILKGSYVIQQIFTNNKMNTLNFTQLESSYFLLDTDPKQIAYNNNFLYNLFERSVLCT